MKEPEVLEAKCIHAKNKIIDKWEILLTDLVEYKDIGIDISVIRAELKKVTDYLNHSAKQAHFDRF